MLSSAREALKTLFSGSTKPQESPSKGNILIYGGGTVSHVRNHLAICAPAYGQFASALGAELNEINHNNEFTVDVRLTKMAGGSVIETSDELEKDLAAALHNPWLSVVVMNAAVCDFNGNVDGVEPGKYSQRLQSREGRRQINMYPAKKIIPMIKEANPQIYVVAFKTTCGSSQEGQDTAVLKAYEGGHADIVVGNDTESRRNVIYDGKEFLPCAGREALVATVAYYIYHHTHSYDDVRKK